MTKTAVLFVDTKRVLDGSPIASARISSVPLLKRILLDLSRAAIARILVIVDQEDAHVDSVLAETKVDFETFVFDDPTWKTRLSESGESRALVLTSEVLFDYKVLRAMSEFSTPPFKRLAAVDFNDYGDGFVSPTNFFPNDGKIVSTDQARLHESAGAYVAPVEAIAALTDPTFSGIDAVFAGESGTGYFDIGNGFSIRVSSRRDIALAEKLILRYIWKPIDGVHSRLNKRIILPFIRLIMRTPLTPNMISLIGALISLVSAYYFAKGYYVATIIGALLGFASSLLDHVDGSVARLKSMESNFGTYFESVCDFIYYFSFGVGLTVGLYRTSGDMTYVVLGLLAFTGTLISMVTTHYRRREYRVASSFSSHIQKTVTEERGNWIGFIVRNTSFVVRRAALPYYVLILTLVNALPFVLFMLALASNLFWMVQLLITRRHRPVEGLRRE